MRTTHVATRLRRRRSCIGAKNAADTSAPRMQMHAASEPAARILTGLMTSGRRTARRGACADDELEREGVEKNLDGLRPREARQEGAARARKRPASVCDAQLSHSRFHERLTSPYQRRTSVTCRACTRTLRQRACARSLRHGDVEERRAVWEESIMSRSNGDAQPERRPPRRIRFASARRALRREPDLPNAARSVVGEWLLALLSAGGFSLLLSGWLSGPRLSGCLSPSRPASTASCSSSSMSMSSASKSSVSMVALLGTLTKVSSGGRDQQPLPSAVAGEAAATEKRTPLSTVPTVASG